MDAATSLAGTQIGSTLLAVGGFQVLKNWEKFPLIKKGQTAINRLWSIIIAGGIALGIHVTFTGSAAQGWSFVGTIPSVWTILVGLFHWAVQYVYQETGYSILQGLQSLSQLAATIQTTIGAPGATKPVQPAVAVVEVAPKPIV